jgi:hypothetical protein
MCLSRVTEASGADCDICIKMVWVNAVFFLPGIQAIWCTCGCAFIFASWDKIYAQTPMLFVFIIMFCIIFQLLLYIMILTSAVILLIEKCRDVRRRRVWERTNLPHIGDRSQALLLTDPLFNPYQERDSKFRNFLRDNLLQIMHKPFSIIDKENLLSKHTELVDRETLNRISPKKRPTDESASQMRSDKGSKNAGAKSDPKNLLNSSSFTNLDGVGWVPEELMCSICYEEFLINQLMTT